MKAIRNENKITKYNEVLSKYTVYEVEYVQGDFVKLKGVLIMIHKEELILKENLFFMKSKNTLEHFGEVLRKDGHIYPAFKNSETWHGEQVLLTLYIDEYGSERTVQHLSDFDLV